MGSAMLLGAVEAPASAMGFVVLDAAFAGARAFFDDEAFEALADFRAVVALLAVADDFRADEAFFFGADFAERADEADFEREDVGRRTLRRDDGAARFQPTALSDRNEAGIARMPSGPSITASTAASARSARTSEITVAGRRAFAA